MKMVTHGIKTVFMFSMVCLLLIGAIMPMVETAYAATYVWQEGEPSAAWALGSLTLLEKPQIGSKGVGKINRSTPFTYTEINGTWVRIKAGGLDGYALKINVRAKASSDQTEDVGATGGSATRPASEDGEGLSSTKPAETSGDQRDEDKVTTSAQTKAEKTSSTGKKSNDGIAPLNGGSDEIKVSDEWGSMISTIGGIFAALTGMGGAVGLAWCGIEFAYGNEEVANKAKNKAFIIVACVAGIVILSLVIKLGLEFVRSSNLVWDPTNLGGAMDVS